MLGGIGILELDSLGHYMQRLFKIPCNWKVGNGSFCDVISFGVGIAIPRVRVYRVTKRQEGIPLSSLSPRIPLGACTMLLISSVVAVVRIVSLMHTA